MSPETVQKHCPSSLTLDFHPALVILDLDLPAVSGYEVLRNYRSVNVPVVVLSSSASQLDRRRTMELGAREFVQKPNSFDDYKRIVLALIERWIPREGHGGPATAGQS